MADITNKNELKRRIEVFLDELDYSINEDFCKETMKMMREFIGHASHRLDCEESRVKSLKSKLKNYKDLEEQGLLLRLPCKVGDDIYAIPSEVNYRLNKSFGAKGLNAICRQVVDHIEFNSYGYLVSTNEGMTVHRRESFGETWFLTRNEAEQKLKEMESK